MRSHNKPKKCTKHWHSLVQLSKTGRVNFVYISYQLLSRSNFKPISDRFHCKDNEFTLNVA